MIQSMETVTFVRIEYKHLQHLWSQTYDVYPDGRVTELYDDVEQDVFVSEGTITFIRELQSAAYPGVVFENKFQ